MQFDIQVLLIHRLHVGPVDDRVQPEVIGSVLHEPLEVCLVIVHRLLQVLVGGAVVRIPGLLSDAADTPTHVFDDLANDKVAGVSVACNTYASPPVHASAAVVVVESDFA